MTEIISKKWKEYTEEEKLQYAKEESATAEILRRLDIIEEKIDALKP